MEKTYLKTTFLNLGKYLTAAILLVLSVQCKNPKEAHPGIKEVQEQEVLNIMDETGVGRVKVSSLALPSGVNVRSATYTYSGKVLLTIRDDEKKTILAIINDDGTGYREIWSGIDSANEVENVFMDNKRILMGDYVLECYPNIDESERTKLLPIEYPKKLVDDPAAFWLASESIISQDNEHMAWTTIHSEHGAVSFIGKLVRYEGKYVIEEPEIISTLEYFKEDPDKEGYIIPNKVYGGEVKQFVQGGAAITTAGAYESGLARSVLQPLTTDEVKPITLMPGYDETTIVSPDENLGIVMSTRDSPNSNCAIFGLMPRPNSIYVMMDGVIGVAYQYSVTGVRKGDRSGNIGPVLIEIEKSMNDVNYKGVQLNDPEGEWVYRSPISWNDAGKKAMWVEGSDKGIRIRMAELLDYEPLEAVKPIDSLGEIPYAQDFMTLWNKEFKDLNGKIAGKNSGYVIREGKSLEYVNFSDDGKSFINGSERSYADGKNIVYEADIKMTGEKTGAMDCKLTFDRKKASLLFDNGAEGKPLSYGYAEYEGERINVSDMSP
jgi:hypothetical protein